MLVLELYIAWYMMNWNTIEQRNWARRNISEASEWQPGCYIEASMWINLVFSADLTIMINCHLKFIRKQHYAVHLQRMHHMANRDHPRCAGSIELSVIQRDILVHESVNWRMSWCKVNDYDLYIFATASLLVFNKNENWYCHIIYIHLITWPKFQH